MIFSIIIYLVFTRLPTLCFEYILIFQEDSGLYRATYSYNTNLTVPLTIRKFEDIRHLFYWILLKDGI